MPLNDRDSLLERLVRTTELANNIAIRMVDYLQITKGQTHGFREVAIVFLEVCQTLWPVQRGLLNGSHGDAALPTEVIQELKSKVRSVIEDFSSLDLLLNKFLICKYIHQNGTTY